MDKPLKHYAMWGKKQSQKVTYCMILLYECPEQTNSQTEGGLASVVRGQRERRIGSDF